jgi:hypothetical protein
MVSRKQSNLIPRTGRLDSSGYSQEITGNRRFLPFAPHRSFYICLLACLPFWAVIFFVFRLCTRLCNFSGFPASHSAFWSVRWCIRAIWRLFPAVLRSVCRPQVRATTAFTRAAQPSFSPLFKCPLSPASESQNFQSSQMYPPIWR